MAKRSRILRRIRRSLLAIALIVYAHAMLAAGLSLILFAPSHTAGVVGAGLLGALFTLVAVATGAVMGSRLHRDETPLPPIADIDRQLSGGDPAMAEELQEQLDFLAMNDPQPRPSAYSMTAPESRRQ